MGCAASKLDGEEAVQICRDRKNFIKKAIELRNRSASDHIAYLQSLVRVSAALIQYVGPDDDFLLGSYQNPPLMSLKKLGHEINGVHRRQKENKKVRVVNHLRRGGNTSVLVEEKPEQEEMMSVGSYYNAPGNQSSPWDLLWSLFPSLDSYGYPSWTDYDRIIKNDDDDDGDADVFREIREEEGIPELEPVSGDENEDRTEIEKPKSESKNAGVQVGGGCSNDSNREFENVQEAMNKSSGPEEIKASAAQSALDLEVPEFGEHVNRRATSMAEVVKDMERQFMRIYESSEQVSVMLEVTGRAQNSHVWKADRKMGIFPSTRSTLSKSSARFDQASSISNDGKSPDHNDCLDMFFMEPISHQATLERLYEWEKKLYEEVKAGERVRIAYEKKCMQLKGHDVNGEDPFEVEQTITSIRDLYTHFRILSNSCRFCNILKEIDKKGFETIPNLFPCRLSCMWRAMAEGHGIQKSIIKDLKIVVISGSGVNPSKPARCAGILAAEVYNWSRCLRNWIKGMRSYAGVLSKWASRCAIPDGAKAPQVFRVCSRWSRLLDSVSEKRAVEGMEFFAAGMASVSAQQLKAEGARLPPEEAASVAAKIAEIAPRVLCVGLSAAVGSMAELALGAARGYDGLLRRSREEVKCAGKRREAPDEEGFR